MLFLPVDFCWDLDFKLTHYLPSLSIDKLFWYTLLYYRLGEVTLKDFKAAIDREGNHRYHFKALDPEFGTVKEEVQNPGASWECYWSLLN
jgi:hypothetical protein